MSKGRNLTLHLPEHLIHQLRVFAALRNQSMTAVVKEAIERTLAEDTVRDAATTRLIHRLQNAPDRGSWRKNLLDPSRPA